MQSTTCDDKNFTNKSYKDDDKMTAAMTSKTRSIERYVPLHAINSLSEDVPGYYGSNKNSRLQQDNTITGTITTTAKATATYATTTTTTSSCVNGPVCWKCHGDGYVWNKRKTTDKNCSKNNNYRPRVTENKDTMAHQQNKNKNKKTKGMESSDDGGMEVTCENNSEEVLPLHQQTEETLRQRNDAYQSAAVDEMNVSRLVVKEKTTTTTATTSAIATNGHSNTNNPNNSIRTNQKECTVCRGTGRISMFNPNNQILDSNNHTGDIHPTGCCGIITRGRQRQRQRYLTSYNDTDSNTKITGPCHHLSYSDSEKLERDVFVLFGPDPVGYSVPYWGDIVKGATNDCYDVKVDDVIDFPIEKIEQERMEVQQQQRVQHERPIWLPIGSDMEQLCNLVGEWRILQKIKSHRWTTDDLVTATIAAKELWKMTVHSNFKINNGDGGGGGGGGGIGSFINNSIGCENNKNIKESSSSMKMMKYLDLGTGNGSVLQMVLWASFYQKLDKKQQQQQQKQQKQQSSATAAPAQVASSSLSHSETTRTLPCTTSDEKNDNDNNEKKNSIGTHTTITNVDETSTVSSEKTWVSLLACAVGVEARNEAVQLARRSIEFNLGIPATNCNNSNYNNSNSNGNSDSSDYNGDGNCDIMPATGTDSSTTKKHTVVKEEENNIDNQTNRNIPLVEIIHSDFRSLLLDEYYHASVVTTCTTGRAVNHGDRVKVYDLITGTPPYFQVDFTVTVDRNAMKTKEHEQQRPQSQSQKKANPAEIVDNESVIVVESATIRQGGMPLSYQSAPARCEFRGGIEEYCHVACTFLRPGTGRFVVCLNYINHKRALTSFVTYGLVIQQIHYVRGKVGRDILFCVYVLSKPITTEAPATLSMMSGQHKKMVHDGFVETTSVNDDTVQGPVNCENDDKNSSKNENEFVASVQRQQRNYDALFSASDVCSNDGKDTTYTRDITIPKHQQQQQQQQIDGKFEEHHLSVRDVHGRWTTEYVEQVLNFMSIPSFVTQ